MRVAILTMNPAIDGACEAEAVFPTHKIRTHDERYDPGGGGINVARVLARLGRALSLAPVEVIYLAGGATGALLDELLDQHGLDRRRITIQDHTRQSLAVYERSSGKEFRFVPDGPLVTEGEWQAAFDHVAGLDCGWLVASGSLPRGVPVDFYARIASALAGRDVRVVVDTSGPALAAALDQGGFYLVKPSQGEFEALVGRKLPNAQAVGEAAMEMVRSGKAAHVAVSMGHQGAVLAHAGGVIVRRALDVPVKSATGAGDSFVGGMVHGFLRGEDAAGAFRWGMAAGTAAVMSPGTDLCHPEAVAQMWEALRNG